MAVGQALGPLMRAHIDVFSGWQAREPLRRVHIDVYMYMVL